MMIGIGLVYTYVFYEQPFKVEATKCEVCNVQRALPKEDLPGSDVLASSDSDIPLVNSEVIKVKLLLLFFVSLLFYYHVLRESSNVFSLM